MSERRLLLASGAYIDLSEYLLKSEAETLYAPLDAILNKQDKLISGTNIKTINNENILGSGNITISLTESDIAAMGFTKNTGTYSKPSTGIPKSDLASAVQTSLGKADTALQSYTEQYKGTVTGVKINGTTKNPSSGIVDLGTVITAHQTLKTINGESIIGSGDITISGGSTNTSDCVKTLMVGMSGIPLTPDADGVIDLSNNLICNSITINGQNTDKYKYGPGRAGNIDLGYIHKQLVEYTSSSMTLSPNIYYRNTSTSLSTLTITLGSVSNSNIINEYFIEFTISSSGTTVSLPSGIKWMNGVTPTFEASTTYQISIVNNLGTWVKFN